MLGQVTAQAYAYAGGIVVAHVVGDRSQVVGLVDRAARLDHEVIADARPAIVLDVPAGVVHGAVAIDGGMMQHDVSDLVQLPAAVGETAGTREQVGDVNHSQAPEQGHCCASHGGKGNVWPDAFHAKCRARSWYRCRRLAIRISRMRMRWIR